MLSLFCLALILLSVKIYISSQVEEQKVLFQQKEKEFEASGIQEFEQRIKIINQDLERLDSFYRNQINLTALIEQVSDALPPEIYLNNFSFNALSGEEKYIFKVSLSGFSLHRAALFEFKENLQAQENFEQIYFPLASWVKPNNIDFNLSFKIR